MKFKMGQWSFNEFNMGQWSLKWQNQVKNYLMKGANEVLNRPMKLKWVNAI